MIEPVTPATGWGVLHLFCKVRRDRPTDSEAIVAAVKGASAGDHQVVSFALLGHKGDLGFLALGPDLWRLQSFQAALQAAGLELADSYVSLTEVSEYAKGMAEELLDARLHPKLPPEGKPAICFYPMSKRRAADHNWYALPYEDRKELMLGHGKTGRTFAGRVLQIRKFPEIHENVVTYTAIVSAPNPDLLLLPGMTAALRIVISDTEDILKIPNQALRFRPAGAISKSDGRENGRASSSENSATVWTVGDDGRPAPVAVKLGVSDEQSTQLSDGSLAQDQRLIVGTAHSQKRSSFFGVRLGF